MDKRKLNGFNNGRDISDGVGGKKHTTKKMSVKDQIKLRRKNILSINNEIIEIAISKMDNFYPIKHVIGTWDCEKSPLDLCVYDRFEDNCLDECIFCGDPSERK